MRDTASSTLVTIENIPLEANISIADENGSDPDEQSQLVVEQALQSINFHENSGFVLKYERSACPDLSTPPSIISLGSSRPWALAGPSHFGTISLKQGDKEVLNFRYHSQKCLTFCGTKDRVSDVYVPQLQETIGRVECGAFGHGGTVTDFVSKSIFLLSQVASQPAPKIHITDDIGNIVSVAEGSRGFRRRGGTTWTDFKFKYSQPAENDINLPASAKILLVVGFFMWVFVYQEKKAGDRWAVIWLAVMVFLVFASIWPISLVVNYMEF
ncbi:hypothetical protein Ocin01_15218 [Orchesella cincta]|uniref:Transmembrane protein n=1 Tax=Orchesella cincta TaxID=48709 RepID=A0A1D2MF04_ORCCI|nr:hypothetical protein Ocin01_15218 [Orchesella cincta]